LEYMRLPIRVSLGKEVWHTHTAYRYVSYDGDCDAYASFANIAEPDRSHPGPFYVF
jgi:hypothetical protein